MSSEDYKRIINLNTNKHVYKWLNSITSMIYEYNMKLMNI